MAFQINSFQNDAYQVATTTTITYKNVSAVNVVARETNVREYVYETE